MSDQVANSEAEQPVVDDFSEEIPMEAADGPQADSDPSMAADTTPAAGEKAHNVQFDELGDTMEAEAPEANLDVILNIPVTLSMELGRTQMTIQELMDLKRGSVVKFNRMAGEPMDVLVNGTLIAHGEVVVINDKFGIRLIDVISPAERVRKLR